MRRLRSWWRLRQHTALAAAEADIVTLAQVLADRTDERDAARREVDELAEAIGREVAARVEAERERDGWRLRGGSLPETDAAEAARHAQVERTGGR